jgi:hypothetical protein
MKKRFLQVCSLLLTTLLSITPITVSAYNDDSTENTNRYYAFNQFFLDHFAGCANGDVDYLSDYPCPPGATTTPLQSASAADRMTYIADNNWIPIAGYSPEINVMSFYFAGEQNLSYGSKDIIQLDPSCADKSLADFVSGHSKGDVKALNAMTKTAESFDFYLEYLPEYTLPGIAGTQIAEGNDLSPVYKDLGEYIKLFESKRINIYLGEHAVLKLKTPVKLDSLMLSKGSVLDLSQFAVKDLAGINSLSNITSAGATVKFPADATEKDHEKFLKKVRGTFRVG